MNASGTPRKSHSITPARLRRNGACFPWLSWFEKRYPKGMRVTRRSCFTAVQTDQPWLWVVAKFCTNKGFRIINLSRTANQVLLSVNKITAHQYQTRMADKLYTVLTEHWKG